MAAAGDVRITLREAVDATLEAQDSSAVCAAYTNLGLSHYARKRYDDAIESFEEQILFLTRRHPDGDFNDEEREVLCFAYRLLAQLYAELGQPEQAAAYSRRCKEVEIDVSLQALVGATGDAEEGLAEPVTGNAAPSFTALRDQLLNNVEEIAPILLYSPKFPAMLDVMVTRGFKTAEQVLQVLLPLLAQPHVKVPKKRQKQILTAVSGLLCLLMGQEGFGKVESKLLKMSLVILRFLVRGIPSSFEELAVTDVDQYIRQHVPVGSTLLTLWSELLLELKMKSKGAPDGSPRSGRVAVSKRDRPPPSPSSSSLSDRDRSGSRRTPSFLADTSTYSSSETDTTTFISMVSDDEDLSWNHLVGPA